MMHEVGVWLIVGVLGAWVGTLYWLVAHAVLGIDVGALTERMSFGLLVGLLFQAFRRLWNQQKAGRSDVGGRSTNSRQGE